MRVGRHKEKERTWKVGNMEIEETKKYKYLGDIITNDGRHKENLTSRKIKMQATTTHIHTIASSETLNKIETAVLLELHEKISITSLLSNSESWNLNKGEEDFVEKIEIQAIKDLFDLPLHTPTAAIIFTFGLLYTKQRIDKKQLIYLHKVLNKQDDQWTKRTLKILNEVDIGWGKHIKSTLTSYDLPTDFPTIKNTHPTIWKNTVQVAIEKKNLSRLHQDCHKKVNGTLTEKSKTKSLLPQLTNPGYKREAQREMFNSTKQETKTLMITRFGMLECGKNFRGSIEQSCKNCKCIDDENHRLNYCIRWRDINLYDCNEKVDLNIIYSDSLRDLKPILSKIETVWNTKNAYGTMNMP